MTEQFNLGFSDRLKQHIVDLGKESHIKRPIPAIVLASFEGRKEEIVLALYDKDKVPAIDIFKVFESEGIEFLIPQTQIHEFLNGRVLDIGDGKLLMDD